MKDRLHLPGVGIDLKKMEKAGYERNAFLSELKIPEDALVMLSVAEFTGRKNLGAAIRAMSSIPEPALHYLICGTGPLEEELKSLVKELGLTKRVHFLGQRSDIYDIVKAVDFFCFPSIREGLPVALMEAMAAGLPAVCRNTRGNNDLIDEKGGVFFEEPDAASVQRAIETMLGKRKKWPAMGEHNREKIKDYDISRVDQIMRATYRGLLGKDD
jgi:glycosyltransferase involved in cell wall biosynthesis